MRRRQSHGPGSVVEIPSLTDRQSCFIPHHNRPDHEGEVLTVLVRPRPTPDIGAGPKPPQQLSSEQVAMLETDAKSAATRIDATNEVGKTYKRAEREAGESARADAERPAAANTSESL